MVENGLKKILFIVQLPPPVHGASMMNNYVVNSEVIKSNFNIDVINFQFVESIKDISRFSFLKIYKAIGYGFKIVGKVHRNNPDLVYLTLTLQGYALYRDALYVLLLKLLNRKIVYHLHSQGVKKNSKNYFKKWLYTFIFKNANVICLSRSLVADFADICKSIPYIVPNGILKQEESNSIVHHTFSSTPKILYLSHLKVDKGVLILIEALKKLKDEGYNFNARLVGAPSDLSIEYIKTILKAQNLSDSVQVVGPLFGDEKNSEFRNADFFVNPTFNDAFPLVILEAMQFGVAVISTFEGGIPDIIVDGETGFLIETQNAQILADKIALLLKNHDLCIEMGRKGHQRFLDNFTLDHFENNLNKTFHAILGD